MSLHVKVMIPLIISTTKILSKATPIYSLQVLLHFGFYVDSRGFANSLPMSMTYLDDISADLSVLVDDDWRTSINVQFNSRISFVLPNEG